MQLRCIATLVPLIMWPFIIVNVYIDLYVRQPVLQLHLLIPHTFTSEAAARFHREELYLLLSLPSLTFENTKKYSFS